MTVVEESITSPVSAAAGQWRMMAASATGTRHARQGAANQDACAVQEAAPGVVIAVVADGAGSAAFGGDGAHIAVTTATRGLTEIATALHADPALADDPAALLAMLELVFTDAQAALVRGAASGGVPLAQLRTTLGCLLMTESLAVAGQVGDGAIALVYAGGELELALRPRRGEYANATYFLTELPHQRDSFVSRVITAPLIGCLLTSDGLLDLAFTAANVHCTPFPGFMAPLFKRLAGPVATERAALDAKLRGFLDRPLIRDKTADDLSLILALRAGVTLPTLFAAPPPPTPAPVAAPPESTTTAPGPIITLAAPLETPIAPVSDNPAPALVGSVETLPVAEAATAPATAAADLPADSAVAAGPGNPGNGLAANATWPEAPARAESDLTGALAASPAAVSTWPVTPGPGPARDPTATWPAALLPTGTAAVSAPALSAAGEQPPSGPTGRFGGGEEARPASTTAPGASCANNSELATANGSSASDATTPGAGSRSGRRRKRPTRSPQP